MGSMIGRDHINISRAKTLNQRVHVFLASQWRIHLHVSVVGSDLGISQEEMMRGDFTSEQNLVFFGGLDDLERVPRGDVRDVDSRPGLPGQNKVACYVQFLGRRIDALEA